jgi:O-antigen ligase
MAGIRVTKVHELNWPRAFIQAGILATFALIPVWYRFPGRLPLLPPLYVSQFLILLPILWSIAWWLIAGLPGFKALRSDSVRAGWALALLLLALWVLASPLWAFQRTAHPEVAQSASLQFGIVALFAVVVACAAPPRRVMIGSLVVGVLWNSLVTLGQVANQGSIGLRVLGEFTLGVNQPGIGYLQTGDARWLRPYSLLPHPNMLAGFFAVGLLATLPWLISRQRVLCWAGSLIFTLGLWGFLLTFSRGAWIGFAAGAFAIFPLLLRSQAAAESREFKMNRLATLAAWRFQISPRPLITLAVSLAVAVPFVLTFHPFLAARAGVGGESIELRSVSDRVVFATFAYDSVIERPIIGVGIGNFPWRTSYFLMGTRYDLRGDNVHHVLLSAWAELGLVGYSLLVIALVLGVETVLRSLRPAARNEQVIQPAFHGQMPVLARFERAYPHTLAGGLPASGDQTAAIALFGGFMALTIIGLLDHYPWTILQFQAAWWGLLAAARSG